MAIQYRHLERVDGVTKLAAHRIRVLDIDDQSRLGLSPNEIAYEYDLPLAAVYEALAYAMDHPDEITALREGEEAVLAELRKIAAGHDSNLSR